MRIELPFALIDAIADALELTVYVLESQPEKVTDLPVETITSARDLFQRERGQAGGEKRVVDIERQFLPAVFTACYTMQVALAASGKSSLGAITDDTMGAAMLMTRVVGEVERGEIAARLN